MSMNDSSAASALVYANRRAQLRTLIDHRSAGNIAAFADQFGYSRSRVSQFLSDTYNEGRSIGERAARALEEAAVVPFGWLDTRGTLADTSGHCAELRSAIAQTRLVFEGEPVAVDVLAYLESALVAGAAGAPVPAQTGIAAGGGNASLAEEGLAAAGAEPVVAPDPFRVAARQAVMHQARADLAQGEGAPVAGSEWPAWARQLDKVAVDVEQIAAHARDVVREMSNILGTVGADVFDQAAAAMAAESAKKVADAEWFASRCTTAAPAPVDTASTSTTIAHLVVEVDTTQLDAALAKAEQLKLALAGLSLGGASL